MRISDWSSDVCSSDLGVQRHLKVLGIFARLRHRDGKLRYLADAPRFLGYLDDVLPHHRQLDPLRTIIDRHVRPALAGCTQSSSRPAPIAAMRALRRPSPSAGPSHPSRADRKSLREGKGWTI